MAREKASEKGLIGSISKTGVFVSWSGTISRRIAEAIGKGLVQNVFQDVQTFVSTNDIDAGSNWFGRITQELEATDIGIVCLTSDNLASQWIHFEAGALAKRVTDKARLIPYMYRITAADITPPLSMYQAVSATKEGTFALLQSINKVRNEQFEAARLQEIFEKWWPGYEADLKTIPQTPESGPPPRPEREQLAEMLAILRNMDATQKQAAPSLATAESSSMSKQALRVQVLSKIGDLEVLLLPYKGDPDVTKTFNLRQVMQSLEKEYNKLWYG
jgi:hypothetical protein